MAKPVTHTYPPQDRIMEMALAGEVIVNIGQIAPETERKLNKLTRAGEMLKWRGYWHPVPGAPFGIGPLKTCWGLASKYGAEQEAA
jgi:hypothetical protein